MLPPPESPASRVGEGCLPSPERESPREWETQREILALRAQVRVGFGYAAYVIAVWCTACVTLSRGVCCVGRGAGVGYAARHVLCAMRCPMLRVPYYARVRTLAFGMHCPVRR